MAGAIVFDLDGTLIDSAPDIHAATNLLLAEDGLEPLTFAEVKSFIGKGVPHLVARVLEAVGEAPEGPRHGDYVRRFEARYETAVGLTLTYPGVPDALCALRDAGMRLGLCTNKPIAPTRAVLDHLGLTDFFGAIIGGDSLPWRKPDARPLLATFEALGAAGGVYVGDSEVDAETASAAGTPFLLFTEGYRKKSIEALAPRAHFSDFAALPALVFAAMEVAEGGC